MSRNSSTGASSVKVAASNVSTGEPEARPKDAGYLAHQAGQLAAQLEILHTFAMQNEEACKSVLVGAIGAAFDVAANLSRELDVLEAAE